MTTENTYKAVALEEIDDGDMVDLVVADRPIVIFRRGDEVYALDDNCDHTDSPLAGGSVEDCIVTCPWHGAEFDIRTGENLGPPANGPTPSHKAFVKDGDVYVVIKDA